MAIAKVLQLELEVDDAALLASIRLATGGTQAAVLRWALRYYAAHGPWAANSRARRSALGTTGPLDVGPLIQEVR